MAPPSALAFVALLTLSAMVSGCASPPSDDGQSLTSSSTTQTTAPAAPSIPIVLRPVTATCDVTRTNAGTPAGLGVYGDRFLADNGLGPATECALDTLFSNHTWAHSLLVEVEWTPGPSTTAADAWIESTACQPTPTNPCPAPYESSPTSPLTLVVEGDDFATHAPADLLIQVAGEGLAAQQSFHVSVTLFANATVDADFTALD